MAAPPKPEREEIARLKERFDELKSRGVEGSDRLNYAVRARGGYETVMLVERGFSPETLGLGPNQLGLSLVYVIDRKTFYVPEIADPTVRIDIPGVQGTVITAFYTHRENDILSGGFCPRGKYPRLHELFDIISEREYLRVLTRR